MGLNEKNYSKHLTISLFKMFKQKWLPLKAAVEEEAALVCDSGPLTLLPARLVADWRLLVGILLHVHCRNKLSKSLIILLAFFNEEKEEEEEEEDNDDSDGGDGCENNFQF